MVYSAAFMLGLLGSLHCAGMCGPIALALPVRTTNPWLKFIKYLAYNSGRVFTYSLLGLIIGTIGKGVAMTGLQQAVSIISGIVILLTVFAVHHPLKSMASMGWMLQGTEKLKDILRKFLRLSSTGSLFLLGMVNGLLPCGMVYAAIMGAFAMSSPLSGSLFMALFGLGTFPMMLLVAYSGSLLNVKARITAQKIAPYFACIVAALLILRGLNLDIPYVSPAMTGGTVHKCH